MNLQCVIRTLLQLCISCSVSACTVMTKGKYGIQHFCAEYAPLRCRAPVCLAADLPQTEVLSHYLYWFLVIIHFNFTQKSFVDLSTTTQANAGIELESILVECCILLWSGFAVIYVWVSCNATTLCTTMQCKARASVKMWTSLYRYMHIYSNSPFTELLKHG